MIKRVKRMEIFVKIVFMINRSMKNLTKEMHEQK